MIALHRGWMTLALAVLFLVPIVPAGEPAQTAPAVVPQGPTSYVRVHVTDADAASFGDGVEVVERYDSFVLARATQDAVARLEDQGMTVVPEDMFSLHVNGYTFDTREPVRVPPMLAAAPPFLEGHSYQIVQFRGPVKQEWVWELQATGAEVVSFVPNNAFVVRATREQTAGIAAVHEVQWTGAYHPAFRISPDLLAADGDVTIKIITFEGQPVAPVVVALNKMGYRSIGRWGDGPGVLSWGDYSTFGLVRARVDARSLVPLARLNDVVYIEPQLEMQLHNQQEQFVLQTNATVDVPGVRRIWDMGIRGEFQTIGIADSGLDYDHAAFRHAQAQVTLGSGATSIYNVTNPARRKVIRYLTMSQYLGVDPWSDPEATKDEGGFCGFGHGTATSSAAAGSEGTVITPDSLNDGMAPNAKLVMMDIGTVDASCNTLLSYIPDDYGTMYAAAYAAPASARIFSNSWGAANSAYTLEASMVDRFMWNNPQALVFFSQGNNPPNPTVGSPATSKSVVSVGAASAWNNREAVGGVSRGPTTDGRRKPDVSTFFSTVAPGGTSNSDGDLTTLNSGDTGFGGTSFASPLAAGLAALARQYFIQGWYPRGQTGGVAFPPSGALLKAMLAASSMQMTGAGSCPAADAFFPNIAQGWGRVNLDEALYFAGDTRKLFVVDHTAGIHTGDTLEYVIRVGGTGARFRAMLAWSDAPASPGASPALVNNLDLQVTDPGNNVYRGNVRSSCGAGQTVTGGSFDTLNTIEGVLRNVPATGTWRIRVIGANVPMGPQPFGLVVLSDVDRTWGVVELDRTIYNEADSMTIKVTDSDGPSPLDIPVQVTSNTEPGGEIVNLPEVVGGANIWRTSPPFPTDYGVPTPGDGRLQVSCGDTITVTYDDQSPPHQSMASARVECDPPAISNVRVTGLTNAAATIRWDTDRPANSVVYYGTTPSVPTVVTDNALTVSHAVTLTGLTGDTLYYYDVASTRVGRTTRDDDGGRHYRFRTTEQAEILLVASASDALTTERVGMYRNALAAASWSWNEWEVATQGEPDLASLQTYKAVLWQAGLEQYPPMTDTQAPILRSYVNTGGRIMFSGHDYAWAACDAASAYRTTARCSFVQSIMKMNYLQDPATWTQERGVALDPISGAYVAGVGYVAHRSGGAGDEGTSFAAGGLTSTVWLTNTGDPVMDDGLKWESSLNNGTGTPGCVWCGTRARVASYLFEFTGINFIPGVPGNAQRTDILNKTIVWLIGRSPPIVQVTNPNGGETIVTNSLQVDWQRSQPLGSQEVWYSRDAGASWTLEATVLGTDVTATLDISNVANWPNGCSYMIRIVVYDTGIPPPVFKAQDASDGTFCISRPGGDVQGPLVRSGSLRLFPNPVRESATVTFNATIDDTNRGGSDIFGAEFFVQATEPTAIQYGTGWGMNATTGFNTPVEDVQWSGPAPAAWTAGSTLRIWVHGLDDAVPTRNWGDFANRDGANRSFLVIVGSVVPPPDPPTDVQAELTGVGFADVRITWAYGGPAIDRFDVYFGTVYDPAGAGYAKLNPLDILPTQFSYVHSGGGTGDPANYFYYVRAANLGGTANSAEQSAKFTRSLGGGWQIVSIPVIPVSSSLTTALQTVSWRTARTFVAGSADPWRAAYSGRPGDLSTVSTGMALWVELAAGGWFAVAGKVPTSTTITLIPGWNFVGFARFSAQNAAASFAGLGVTNLEGYVGAPQYYLVRLPIATTNLNAGLGYWVYVGAAGGGDWIVTN